MKTLWAMIIGGAIVLSGGLLFYLFVWNNPKVFSIRYDAEYSHNMGLQGRGVARFRARYDGMWVAVNREAMVEGIPLVVLIDGAEYHLSDLTPDVMRALGAKQRTGESPRQPETVRWVIERSACSINVIFVNERMVTFGYFVRGGGSPCGLAVRWRSGPIATLPLTSEAMLEAFGTPVSVRITRIIEH